MFKAVPRNLSDVACSFINKQPIYNALLSSSLIQLDEIYTEAYPHQEKNIQVFGVDIIIIDKKPLF
jgi:hypothetical protein